MMIKEFEVIRKQLGKETGKRGFFQTPKNCNRCVSRLSETNANDS